MEGERVLAVLAGHLWMAVICKAFAVLFQVRSQAYYACDFLCYAGRQRMVRNSSRFSDLLRGKVFHGVFRIRISPGGICSHEWTHRS